MLNWRPTFWGYRQWKGCFPIKGKKFKEEGIGTLQKIFQANLDWLKCSNNKCGHENSKRIEEEKYQNRVPVDIRTPSKQDQRSFRR